MKAEERVQLLRSVPELVGLRDAARHFDEVRVAAGEMLAEEGALCHHYLVVAEGTLQTQRQTAIIDSFAINLEDRLKITNNFALIGGLRYNPFTLDRTSVDRKSVV